LAILVLLNNFLHDFSAAGWLFGTVLLWSIFRKRNPESENNNLMVKMLTIIIFLMQLSFIGIVFFGIIRAIAYKSYEWNAAAGQNQVTLLIVKHVIFTLVFLPGAVFYIKARRLIRKARIEKAI
jgi:hypothetical protein